MQQDDQHNSKFIRMTTAPVQRLVCSLAVPTIISMMVTALYNLADTFFVGQIGTEATAGVGLVFPVMTIIQAFGFFFGQGSGNYISRSLGAQRRDRAAYMAATGSICAFLFALSVQSLCTRSKSCVQTPAVTASRRQISDAEHNDSNAPAAYSVARSDIFNIIFTNWKC